MLLSSTPTSTAIATDTSSEIETTNSSRSSIHHQHSEVLIPFDSSTRTASTDETVCTIRFSVSKSSSESEKENHETEDTRNSPLEPIRYSCVTPSLSEEEDETESSPIKSPIAIKKLKSSLKKSFSNKKKERRVRGLWGCTGNINLFSQLHNDLLVDAIFTYLTIEELILASKVCQRWRYCAFHPHRWTSVVITEDKVLSYYAPVLLDIIHAQSKHLKQLRILDIQHRLDIETFIVSVGSCLQLKQLHLSNYTELQDKHVNLLLLMQKKFLTDIRFEYCPMLTKISVELVLKHCPNATHLSFKGCQNISNETLSIIAPKLRAESSLSSLFMLPQPSSSTLSKKTLSLLDLSHTCVTAQGITNSLLSSNCQIQQLLLAGTGESWNNFYFIKLYNTIQWNHLQYLDISTSNPLKGSSLLTDEAFISMPYSTSISSINLSGQTGLTSTSLSYILRACPNLQTLILDCCTSIITNVDELQQTFTYTKNSLKYLSLYSVFGMKRTFNSTNSKLVHDFISYLCEFKSTCQALQYLDLECCYTIDKKAVDLIVEHCPNIQFLKLNNTLYSDLNQGHRICSNI